MLFAMVSVTDYVCASSEQRDAVYTEMLFVIPKSPQNLMMYLSYIVYDSSAYTDVVSDHMVFVIHQCTDLVCDWKICIIY